jgi:inner membrane protein
LEPLTHTLAGAALARTPLGRGSRLAPVALVLGAVAPDIDVLSYFWGADHALGFRRGWTHGPPALLVLAGLLTLVCLAVDALARRRDPTLAAVRPRRLFLAALLGTATHPVLDWLNTYGIRWLMPFDRRWYYGDALFIVDPWLWLILGGVLFLGRSRPGWRAVSGWLLLAGAASVLILGATDEVLSRGPKLAWIAGLALLFVLDRVRWPRARAAPVGMSLAVLYIVSMLGVGRVSAGWVERELARKGIEPTEAMMLAPAPANPFRWGVVAETTRAYVCGSYSWLGGPRLVLEQTIAKPGDSPVLAAALAAPQVQGAVGWMRFPFAAIDETPEGYTVYLLDARYVRARVRGFGGAVVRLDRELRVLTD